MNLQELKKTIEIERVLASFVANRRRKQAEFQARRQIGNAANFTLIHSMESQLQAVTLKARNISLRDFKLARAARVRAEARRQGRK